MAKQKLAPVTHESLKEIFISPAFVRGIRKTTKIGLKRHTESHFSAWRKAFSGKSKFFFPNQTTYDMPFSTSFELDSTQYKQIDNQQLLPFVHYHCHPNPYACPSEQDLRAHFDIRNQYNLISDDGPEPRFVENFHLDCIGTIRDAGKYHHVLVFQNNSGITDRLEGEFAYQRINDELGRRKDDNKELAKTFDSLNGWNAHLLTYEKSGSSYILPEKQLQGLSKFAYTPALIRGQ